MSTTTIILSLIICAFMYAAYLRAAWQQKQLLRWYANRTEPIVVLSRHPSDDTVEDRAAYHRDMMRLSGNRFSVPIIPYAYAQFRQGDPRYISWDDYRMEAAEFEKMARAQFQARVEGADINAYKAYVLGQAGVSTQQSTQQSAQQPTAAK